MRSIDDLKRWKSYGFALTPIQDGTKKPKLKDGKWSSDWSDQELLNSERLGFFHKDSNVFTVDFDDKSYVSHGYMSLLPMTFTDGKVIKFDGQPTSAPTHRTYKINGHGALNFKYPAVKSKDGGLLIETLSSTQTIFHGGDRQIHFDQEPVEVDLKLLEDRISLICFFTEVEKAWVKDGQRDEAHLRLAGSLARLPEDRFPTDLLEKAVVMLCNHTADDEIKNRTKKITYQRKQLKNGKEIFGITELRSFLGDVELAAYGLLIDQSEQEELQQEQQENTDPKEYPLIDGLTLDSIEYPKVDYLMNPILSTRSFNQIYGWYESGKTIFGLALSIAMSSGNKFLDWECDNSIPSIYVESELPGDVFKSYRWSILQGYLDDGKKFDAKNHFTLTHDDLTNAGFQYGFKSIAVAKAHGKDAAKDYGRKGREILLDLFMKIKQRTGKAPFYFLDNMSRLATFDENKQPDWEPFINWGIDLKNKGIPGCFLHHANKGEGKGSSGSSYIGRLLDTSIQLTKLEDDYRFKMPGNKNLQSSIRFDKSRGFGGSSWASKRILTMDENGQWRHYPYLKQISFVILGLAEQGHTQEEIRAMAKEQMVRDMNDNAYSPSHVDKLYKELVSLKLIEKKRSTVCWNCREPISTAADGSCDKCNTGIPCSNCGKCYCEKPGVKKYKK
tara:strand:- start:922 stop:2934 length:2013 start_codon:yes stop_codon:yes gene_type:complete